MIGSVDGEGFPNMKAMLPPRKREGISEFYFTTNTSSMRVKQYLENPKASIYFYDKRFYRGVMLKGTMEVLTDSKSKEEIWREGDEIYYPLGVTDSDYCVLKFTAQSGRYYSNFRSEDFLVNNLK
jgi:general stress protein 26